MCSLSTKRILDPELYQYNSKYRLIGGTITDYYVNTPLPVSGSIRLVNVNIPLTHNVIDSPNNLLSFVEVKDDIMRKIRVPSGNYTIAELCSLLSQLMTLNSAQEYKVTEQRNMLKIEAKDDFQLIFQDNSIWEQLGFPYRNSIGNTWLAILPPTLSPSGEYYLELNNLVRKKIRTNGGTLGTFPLMLKGNCYEIAKWQNTFLSPVLVTPDCCNMNVKLYDSEGCLVKLKKDWSFTLENIPT